MNVNLLDIVRRIVAEQGEGILGDPQRLKAFFSDLARNESKPLRLAFGRCVEAGAYAALKTAPDAAERASRKAAIARRLRDDQGLDITLCAEALDIIETTLFGRAVSTAPPAPYQQSYPQPALSASSAWPQTAYTPLPQPYAQDQNVPQTWYQQPQATPPPVQIYISQQNQNSSQTQPQPPVRTGDLWKVILVLNILGLNWFSRFITGHIGTGILVLLLDIVTVFAVVCAVDTGNIVPFWILLVAGSIIWIIDLVKICTKTWQMSDGTYLSP
ncbi:MAG: hypothetical protein Pg6C_14800 [Treponemataceae bacterium]|nr:MAG: hypothetical protein Pg6C_14800 [Treponemataceae bacterium]